MDYKNKKKFTLFFITFILLVFLINTLCIAENINYLILIDHSKTMNDIDPDNNIRKDLATLFVDSAENGDYISLVRFASDAKVIFEWTKIDNREKFDICNEIHKSSYIKSGDRDTIKALKRSLYLVEESSSFSKKSNTRILIFTATDTSSILPNKTSSEIDNIILPLISNQVPIYCFEIGTGNKDNNLSKLSNSSNGAYFKIKDLHDIFDTVLNLITSIKDYAITKNSVFDIWEGIPMFQLFLLNKEYKERIDSIKYKNREFSSMVNDFLYWSGKRPKKSFLGKIFAGNRLKPRNYEAVIKDSPDSGIWSVGSNKNGVFKFRSIQPSPFKFIIDSPKKNKYIENDSVEFDIKLETKRNFMNKEYKELLKMVEVFMTVNTPDNKLLIEKLRKEEAIDKNGYRFKGSFRFLTPGNYNFKLSGKFESNRVQASLWEIQQFRNFEVIKPDFLIKINRSSLNNLNPLDNIKIEAEIEKQKSFITDDIDTAEFKLTILDALFKTILEKKCQIVNGNIKTFISSKYHKLKPGNYRIKVSGDHQIYTIKNGETYLKIGNWPDPTIDNINLYAKRLDGNEILPGENASFELKLQTNNGRSLEVGDVVEDVWKITSIKYDNITIKNGGKDLDTIDIYDHFFENNSHRVSTFVKYSGNLIFKAYTIINFKLNLDNNVKKIVTLSKTLKSSPLYSKSKIVPIKNNIEFYVDEIYPESVGTYTIKSWFPNKTNIKAKVRLIKNKKNDDTLPIPINWLNFQKTFDVIPLDDNDQINHYSVKVKIPKEDFDKPSAIYEGSIYFENPKNNEMLGSLALKIKKGSWPQKSNFIIKHNIPKSVSRESYISIKVGKSWKDGSNDSPIVFANLLYKDNTDPLFVNSTIDDKYVVKKLVWGIPETLNGSSDPVIAQYNKGNTNEEFFTCAFFKENKKSQFKLYVKELVLGVKQLATNDNINKKYNNIENQVIVIVRN